MRADGFFVAAMDTSAEENQSREIDSSSEEHEQDDVTEGTHVEEDMGFISGVATVEAEPYRCRAPLYSFTRASHQLMANSIMACRYATAAEIVEADPSFVEAMGQDNTGIEGRWKVFQDRLHAHVDDGGKQQLFFKPTPDKLIAHTGQWQEIVHTFHVDAQDRHFGVSGTIERTRQLWITDTRRHGIPELFVRAYIAVCPVCNPTDNESSTVPLLEGKRTRPPKFSFPVQLEVPVKDLPQKLEALAIEHKVVLRVLHSTRIAPCPFLAEVVSYVCHRGQFKRLREKKESSILEKRRFRASFRCGCNFRIKTLIPITNYFSETGSYDYQTEATAVMLLNPVHVGHEPGSEADLLHLPVHPSAVRECEEDHNDMKDIHAIIRSSIRKSPILRARASELEQATFRFFLTKKETRRLPYYRKSKERLLKDMAGDSHSKHYQGDTSMKVDFPVVGPCDVKEKLSSTQGTRDSCSPYMPARRLGFQKVLARLTDARQVLATQDQQSRVGQREGEASIYYSRHKQGTGTSGRYSARRNLGTHMRWVTDHEYPERYGRDSSRLDLVNKGISQFNRLQLSERMEPDVDVEKPVGEACHAMSHALDRFDGFNHQNGDSSFPRMGCAMSDLGCLTEALKFSWGVDQIDPLATTKRSSFGRQCRFRYMREQLGHTCDPARAEGIFLEGEAGCHSYVSPPGPHSYTRTRKTVGKKRKRNSVFVYDLPVTGTEMAPFKVAV